MTRAGLGSGFEGERQPELARAVHDLGNTIHALSLRLLLLEHTELDPATLGHVHEAQRLTRKSADLIIEVRTLQAAPPAAPGGPLTSHRNPR